MMTEPAGVAPVLSQPGRPAAAEAPIPPHCVLTLHLDDRPGTPTKLAEERVIAFLSRAVHPRKPRTPIDVVDAPVTPG